MAPPMLCTGGIKYLSGPSVHASVAWDHASVSLWTWYFINHLGEFFQIYNFGAFGDKYELIS